MSGGLLRHAGRRIVFVPLSALIVSMVGFAGLHQLAGDPCVEGARPRAVMRLNCIQALGLDQPLPVQYLRWLNQVIHGGFGDQLLIDARNSALVGGLALALVIVFGIWLGALAALNRRRWHGRLLDLVSLMTLSTPNFVIAAILVSLTTVGLYNLTGGVLYYDFGWGKPEQLTVPVLALALSPMAVVLRFTRGSVLEVMRQDHVTTARAKGLGGLALTGRHMIRNALVTVITVLGPIVTTVATGSIVIENIFGIPGLGQDLVQSALGRNYEVFITILTYYALVIGAANVLADVLYGLVDPRVRY